MSDQDRLAAQIRAAYINTALKAYEDAGISGLCAEGRWEIAVQAIRMLDVRALLEPRNTAPDRWKTSAGKRDT